MTKLSTGITAIDRRLNGGLEPGSLVALVTPPTVQSHVVLQQLMAERPTEYVTTLRSAAQIERDLDRRRADDPEATVRPIGDAITRRNRFARELTGSEIQSLLRNERDRAIDELFHLVEDLDENINLMVDPINPLERADSRRGYQKLLAKLAAKVIDIEGLGILHCTSVGEAPAFRDSTLTIADVVWELDLITDRTHDLQIQCSIPKNRGGDSILEKLTLVIEPDRVYTDDSRNI